MDETVISKNGVRIRLTTERWTHITEGHCELAGMREEVLDTISYPLMIFAGNQGELIAFREIRDGKFLVVPYREMDQEGFIITAFLPVFPILNQNNACKICHNMLLYNK